MLCQRKSRLGLLLYKALHGYVDVDISNYVNFINHDRSRPTLNPSLLLQVPLCRTTTFKNSYFKQFILWNSVCRTALPNNFWTLSSFKNILHRTYLSLRNSVFEVDMPCTWSLVRDCRDLYTSRNSYREQLRKIHKL